MLFKTYTVKNEVFLSNIKLKWLFDQLLTPSEIDKSLSNLKPLIDKAKAAIQKIAKEQGFDYVIDATDGGSLILANGKDLMAEVKVELGF